MDEASAGGYSDDFDDAARDGNSVSASSSNAASAAPPTPPVRAAVLYASDLLLASAESDSTHAAYPTLTSPRGQRRVSDSAGDSGAATARAGSVDVSTPPPAGHGSDSIAGWPRLGESDSSAAASGTDDTSANVADCAHAEAGTGESASLIAADAASAAPSVRLQRARADRRDGGADAGAAEAAAAVGSVNWFAGQRDWQAHEMRQRDLESQQAVDARSAQRAAADCALRNFAGASTRARFDAIIESRDVESVALAASLGLHRQRALGSSVAVAVPCVPLAASRSGDARDAAADAQGPLHAAVTGISDGALLDVLLSATSLGSGGVHNGVGTGAVAELSAGRAGDAASHEGRRGGSRGGGSGEPAATGRHRLAPAALLSAARAHLISHADAVLAEAARHGLPLQVGPRAAAPASAAQRAASLSPPADAALPSSGWAHHFDELYTAHVLGVGASLVAAAARAGEGVDAEPPHWQQPPSSVPAPECDHTGSGGGGSGLRNMTPLYPHPGQPDFVPRAVHDALISHAAQRLAAPGGASGLHSRLVVAAALRHSLQDMLTDESVVKLLREATARRLRAET